MTNTLGQRLAHEHKALDALYEGIANRVHCGDAATIDEGWDALEASLLAHMEFEESHLLPRFEATVAAQLRGEHAQIRSALAEMGVAIELHTLREEAIADLLGLLRAHAEREESTLYPWSSAAEALGPRPDPERVLIGVDQVTARGPAARHALKSQTKKEQRS